MRVMPNMVFAAPPVVEFKMDHGSGTLVANTGSAAGFASILGAKPAWSGNAPVNRGVAALDFGTTNAFGYVVQLNQTPQEYGEGCMRDSRWGAERECGWSYGEGTEK